MTMRFPIKSLLFLSISAVTAGCTLDVSDLGNNQPVIHLDGESTIRLALNEAYIEPGFRALDTEDGDITADVLSNSSNVNTQVAGEYQITYRVTDSGNLNAVPAKRTVVVGAASAESEGSTTDTVEGSVTSYGSGIGGGNVADGVPAISSFKLLAFTPDRKGVEVQEVTNGSSLYLSSMPTNLLNIEAVSSDASNTGSVHFVLDGPITLDRYENNAIYTLQTEPSQLNIANGELPVGDYSLAVTPYSSADMGGEKGQTKRINFKVREKQVESNVPAISSFKLLAYTPERTMVEVQEIVDGSALDLSLMPTDLLNIEAVSADASKTGSVHFALDGPMTLDRYENSAIYTLQTEPSQLNIANGELPVGDYSLAVTPYSAPDMSGEKGQTKRINFKVKDLKLEVSSVPKLLAADFVVVNEATGDLDVFERITEGYNLDLGLIPSALINVLAVSEDAAKTGSVHFSLNGPTSIDRYENHAGYTLAAEPASIDITKDGVRNGDYTLIITPYAEADMGGEAGIPLLVNFSVSGTATIDNGTSVVTPPVETVTLTANSDSYSFNVGSGEQPGMSTPVSANDEFDKTSATFTVVSPPKHGTVKMFDLGFFEYTPAPGHAGSDSFTYQVSQNGTTATANASISVYDPQSKQGFTAIVPSPDSKLIYVSNSQGSDTNTCLAPSAPCKSIGAALEKMRSGYPDHVYLKRGDVWRGQSISNVQSGRSASEPSVIAFYGDDGARPRLESDNVLFSVTKRTLAKKHLNIIGLHFYAYKMDPKNPSFTGSSDDHANIKLLTDNENILFEDNVFDLLEIVLQAWDGGHPKDFTFRRNIWTGAYYNKSSYDRNSRPSNMFASKVDGLVIEENVIDRGGWNPDVAGAGANMYNHNLYLQYDNVGNSVVVRNNIITRASSHGVQIRAGGLVENNFFAKNAIAASIGYFNQPLQLGTFAKINRNVITEGHSMIKGQDACQGVNLCTAAVFGTTGNDYGEGDISARDNIAHSLAADDTLWQSGGFYDKYTKLIISAYKLGEAVQTNNISWKWDDAGTKTDGKTYPDPGRTLADYNAYLGGTKNFTAFMDTVLTRPLQTWDERYSANSINNYVREGFGQK